MSEFGESLPRGPLVAHLERLHAIIGQRLISTEMVTAAEYHLREIARYTAQPPLPGGISIPRDMLTHNPPDLVSIEHHRIATIAALPSPLVYEHRALAADPTKGEVVHRVCCDFTGTETVGTAGRARWRYWVPYDGPDSDWGWEDCDLDHPGAPEPPVVI